MRLRCFAIPASLLLLVLVTACGGSGKKAQTTTGSVSPAKAGDAAIRARLTKAGYTVDDANTPGTQRLNKAKGELDAFSVQADFASPNSYHLGVTVFATTADLRAYLKRQAAAEKQEAADPSCKIDPRCEPFFRALNGPHPPIIQLPLGTILYTGVVDKPGAVLPVRSFHALVALASGRAT